MQRLTATGPTTSPASPTAAPAAISATADTDKGDTDYRHGHDDTERDSADWLIVNLAV